MSIIKVKKGLQANLPSLLSTGEFGFSTDTNNLYIGGITKNVLLNTQIPYERMVVGAEMFETGDEQTIAPGTSMFMTSPDVVFGDGFCTLESDGLKMYLTPGDYRIRVDLNVISLTNTATIGFKCIDDSVNFIFVDIESSSDIKKINSEYYFTVDASAKNPFILYNAGTQDLKILSVQNTYGVIIEKLKAVDAQYNIAAQWVTSADTLSKTYASFNPLGNNTIIDWGDGTTTESSVNTQTNFAHQYNTTGDYTITVYSDNKIECKSSATVNMFNKLIKTAINVSGLTDASIPYLFYNCKLLTSVSNDIFDNNVNVTSFSYCFYNCTSLTTIPNNLFDNNVNVTSFSYCFEGCSYLTSIPSGLFDKNVKVTDFSYCFQNCEELISIPQGLFDNNVKVTSFSYCFHYCIWLTSFPQGLFDNCPNVTSFSGCFYNCISLISIPNGLFDNNVNVTTFDRCFADCLALTSIPNGLFDNNVKVTSFSYCFNDCRALTSIPSGLFDNNIKVTSFFSCFENCVKLKTIPQGLFDNNVNVTSFGYCFSDCWALNQPYNCTSPHLPKLWERDGTNGAVKVTNYGDFASLSHSTFRATIPTAWGGTMTV